MTAITLIISPSVDENLKTNYSFVLTEYEIDEEKKQINPEKIVNRIASTNLQNDVKAKEIFDCIINKFNEIK